MDKTIVKALFKEIACKDPVRPSLMGVHFEENRCYATDTHILVVYNESDPRFAGKTLSIEGKEIVGKYPNIDRVIPKDLSNLFRGDLGQLYRACCWWCKQSDSHKDDQIVIDGHQYVISTLRRMLSMFAITSELGTAKMYLNAAEGANRPAVVMSDTFTSIQMPCNNSPEEKVDDVRSYEEYVVISYANFINTYAIESTKPKEVKPSSFDWL